MLCQVCGKNDAKYICPACKIHTCCLECVKRHKIENNCTGVKPKTEFVPLSDMNEMTLVKDCNLLDTVANKASFIKSQGSLKTQKKNEKWKKMLSKACVDRGITVQFMPNMSSRAKENKTKYNDSQKKVFWTLKWRFRSAEHKLEYERLIDMIDENATILDTLKSVIQTSPNDYVSSLDINNVDVLLVAEGAKGGGHYQVEKEYTIQESLFAKTVIEYPIFDIVQKECLSEWKIVTIMDVKEIQVEKPKKIQKVSEEAIPTYESIKDALKLDMIKNILSKTDEAEENKITLEPTYTNKH